MMQIGLGKFGVRDETGNFCWEKLREVSETPQIRAFELKLAQGAKIRGGHVEGPKVTPEIAEIRGVPVWKTIDSPNRFEEFSTAPEMCQFIEKMRETTGNTRGSSTHSGA